MRNSLGTKKISTKQLVMLVFLLGMSIKMFMLPVLMLKTGGRDSWLVMLLCLISELGCLAMLLIAARLSPDQTFFSLMEQTLKKVGAKLISVVLFVYFMLKLLLSLSEVKIFFTVSVYENLPWPVFVIPLLLLLVAFAVKSLRALARTAEIFTPLIVLSVAFLCVLLVLNIDLNNLLPILADGPGVLFRGFMGFPMWYGDFTVLILFLGNMRRTRVTYVATFISGLVASAVVLLFSALLFSAFANVGDLLQYGQNVSSLTQLTFSGYNLGRFDLLVFSIWMISVFVKSAAEFCAAVSLIGYVFGRKRPFAAAFSCAGVLYVLIVFIFSNESLLHGMAVAYMAIPALCVQLAVPTLVLVLSILCAVRRRKQNDNADDHSNEQAHTTGKQTDSVYADDEGAADNSLANGEVIAAVKKLRGGKKRHENN